MDTNEIKTYIERANKIDKGTVYLESGRLSKLIENYKLPKYVTELGIPRLRQFGESPSVRLNARKEFYHSGKAKLSKAIRYLTDLDSNGWKLGVGEIVIEFDNGFGLDIFEGDNFTQYTVKKGSSYIAQLKQEDKKIEGTLYNKKFKKKSEQILLKILCTDKLPELQLDEKS